MAFEVVPQFEFHEHVDTYYRLLIHINVGSASSNLLLHMILELRRGTVICLCLT